MLVWFILASEISFIYIFFEVQSPFHLLPENTFPSVPEDLAPCVGFGGGAAVASAGGNLEQGVGSFSALRGRADHLTVVQAPTAKQAHGAGGTCSSQKRCRRRPTSSRVLGCSWCRRGTMCSPGPFEHDSNASFSWSSWK